MIWALLGLAVLSYIQNMAFTWSSRSRNSGDPSYHRKAAWASNGVYFLTNTMLFSLLAPIMRGEAGWGWFVAAGLIYCASATEGSVHMMRRLIRSESGKRKVGS